MAIWVINHYAISMPTRSRTFNDMSEVTTVPAHIGLILDGNRRWAKDQGLTSFEGHNKGLDVFLKVAPKFYDKGVTYLSAYVFSTENWNRTKDEVSYLMKLFYRVATEKLNELHEKNIKAIFLGRKDRLDKKLVQAMKTIEEKTKNNSRGTLALCLNYGGTFEIADAIKQIVAKKFNVDKIEPELVAKHLYHPELPAVDLLVRTSGEQRLSNFMLWRAAYSELLFLDKHWPDFTEQDIDYILSEYRNRNRRFGA